MGTRSKLSGPLLCPLAVSDWREVLLTQDGQATSPAALQAALDASQGWLEVECGLCRGESLAHKSMFGLPHQVSACAKLIVLSFIPRLHGQRTCPVEDPPHSLPCTQLRLSVSWAANQVSTQCCSCYVTGCMWAKGTRHVTPASFRHQACGLHKAIPCA